MLLVYLNSGDMNQNFCVSVVTSGNSHIGKIARYNWEIFYCIEKCIHIIEEHKGRLNRWASSSLILSKLSASMNKMAKNNTEIHNDHIQIHFISSLVEVFSRVKIQRYKIQMYRRTQNF